MIKIGVIGLGSIAQKAYLPIICNRVAEIHLCARNPEVLAETAALYRISHLHSTLQSLIDSGIEAAFVHTSTVSHEEIIEHLLNNNIHVYVDKPITYDYPSAERLTLLAESRELILMTGFNRRYAPSYRKLTELPTPNMVIMQKNRQSLPGDVRTFVFDDFIHVIDTLRYVFPHPIKNVFVNGRKKDGLLYHVVVQLIAEDDSMAIGIMNRDSGTVEEKLEFFTSKEKWVVYDVAETEIHANKNEVKLGTNDWDSTLLKRGFENIIDDFLTAVRVGMPPAISMRDALLTHNICEQVVKELSEA